MGRYCLDTPPQSDKARWPPVRGSMAAVYWCRICKLDRICVVCARHCHASHYVTVHLKRLKDVGGLCDCGVPPPTAPVAVDARNDRKASNADDRSFRTCDTSVSARKQREQGAKVFVNKCMSAFLPFLLCFLLVKSFLT